MGRKGLGKLSLFSIAKTIVVQTVKNGQRSAFRMELDKIKEKIGEREATYEPEVLLADDIDFDRGTRITITNPKKRIHQAASALRKRLARRFSIIGPAHDFIVSINDEEIFATDRDYYHKVQYLWTFDDRDSFYKGLCANAEPIEDIPGVIEPVIERDGKSEKPEGRHEDGLSGNTPVGEVRGWIGTVDHSGKLKDQHGDNLNRIVILVRGKVADHGDGVSQSLPEAVVRLQIRSQFRAEHGHHLLGPGGIGQEQTADEQQVFSAFGRHDSPVQSVSQNL